MANQEHLDVLKQGVEAWNQWRRKQPTLPILSRAILNSTDLKRVNFFAVDLSGANLRGSDLSGASLNRANLVRADLSGAILSDADLSGTNLGEAHLNEALLLGADLSGARLFGTNLSDANLSDAYLSGTDLNRANLSGANLNGTNFSEAKVGWTIFTNIDLSRVERLDNVRHIGPSSVGIDTIYRSGGRIPLIFLKGSGVPDTIIEYMHSLLTLPFKFHSCFISYSSKDQIFAERLYSDLQSNGVRCWFAPHQMKIGDEIRSSIDESISLHDKLLLLLSRYSIKSAWVAKEVETAFEKEMRQQRRVLFPIMLDDTVMTVEYGWAADIRRSRHIGDFTFWADYDSYQQALDRLLRDLKAEA